jgi:hypothetical protein
MIESKEEARLIFCPHSVYTPLSKTNACMDWHHYVNAMLLHWAGERSNRALHGRTVLDISP